MNIDYTEVEVSPQIEVGSVAPLEAWLLTRLFITTVTRRVDDRGLMKYLGGIVIAQWFQFKAKWTLDDLHKYILPEDDLTKALTDSREMCPELCIEVDRELNRLGKIVVGDINYEKIFQSVLRRPCNLLSHVSIDRRQCNTREEI